MNIDIYRPETRLDLYLFVMADKDPGAVVSSVLDQLGPLTFIKSREVNVGQKIIGADANEILDNIERTGFHLQVSKVADQVSDGGAAIGGGILGASLAGPVGAIIGALIGYALAEHAKKAPDDL
ncbi:YcgL domain-containing protein [Iodobacter fluviatilis]|uniref:YcgL domain n=1 Tax=Iodobacter fluviatilis TaxID=537 RepID=A0A377Q5E7_9NEIS|nr:YcgL domain-containing protein [Iodobacter fluviatilis]TCU84576.1 YcgL domain-containing protein [Iodobacter fluviatilis]STQ90042.1 YcgL domain [Iodobacter fluviatilis]